jgi:nitrite reductase (NO-forming)
VAVVFDDDDAFGTQFCQLPADRLDRQTEEIGNIAARQPEYFVFNGAVDALNVEKPLKANVGETVRIFFGVGGPNYTSSFHVIGEIFDKVYNLGSLSTAPVRDVQTVSVPAGGSTVVEMKLEVPGAFMLVDHALSRVERGLLGALEVDGPTDNSVFRDQVANPVAEPTQ